MILAVLSYYAFNRHCLALVIVQGRSMLPTLQDGDRFILNRLAYLYRSPQRGELAVVRDPGHADLAIKRIVALPGETVVIKGGAVWVNGKRLNEPYLAAGTRTFYPDLGEHHVHLKSDEYFLLGDNRPESEDSRCYGAIRREQIVGTLLQ